MRSSPEYNTPAADDKSIERAVGSDRFITLSATSLPDDPKAAADAICRALERRGYIRPQPKPFTAARGSGHDGVSLGSTEPLRYTSD